MTGNLGRYVTVLGLVCVLAACGGGEAPEQAQAPQSATTASADSDGTVSLPGSRASYSVSRTGSGWVVTDSAGQETRITSAKALRFSDLTVNLQVGDLSKTVAAADLKMVVELYVAFFNRVPDADGLAYWVGQVAAGRSIDDIANSFYGAALLYSSLTGYSESMSNEDFVRVIYRNVLGRTGSSAPPDADVRWWAARLASGEESKGSLIRTMLISAHSFSGHATWGWVAQLLDNKVAVAQQFAVRQGLNYNSPAESISKTMAMAAAVTAADTSAALALVGFSDTAFDLVQPVVSGVAAKGPLRGATVKLYALKADGTKDGLLGTGTTSTDGTGRFAVQLSAQPAGAVMLEVTGGSYTSAYDGSTVTATAALECMLPSVAAAGEAGVAVSPLTTLAARLTRSLAGRGYALTESMQTAQLWTAWQYGLKNEPRKTLPKFDGASLESNPEGVQHALVLNALDALAKRKSPADPEALHSALAADYSDGRFDGYDAQGTRLSLGGTAMATDLGTAEFLKAFALTVTAGSAGWRPGYLDAHFSAGTVTEHYEAKMIPVYVASSLASSYQRQLASPLPKATSFDASATGYSCASGAAISFKADGSAQCGQGAHYECSGGATLLSGNRCSDGGIPVYFAAEIPLYTAPTLQPYTAAQAQAHLAATTVGQPAAGTIPVFTATAVHLLTEAERAAMLANDRAAGDLAAAKVAALGPLNDLQLSWLEKINNAVIASVGR